MTQEDKMIKPQTTNITQTDEDLITNLRKRAEIRRQISTRKSVQEGAPDRISDLLEAAADRIEELEVLTKRNSMKSLGNRIIVLIAFTTFILGLSISKAFTIFGVNHYGIGNRMFLNGLIVLGGMTLLCAIAAGLGWLLNDFLEH